jgi:hypothetical protein
MIGGVSPETCWASYKYEIKFSFQQLHAQQPSTPAKPEVASAVLGSW